jgi:hypothetical protein
MITIQYKYDNINQYLQNKVVVLKMNSSGGLTEAGKIKIM